LGGEKLKKILFVYQSPILTFLLRLAPGLVRQDKRIGIFNHRPDGPSRTFGLKCRSFFRVRLRNLWFRLSVVFPLFHFYAFILAAVLCLSPLGAQEAGSSPAGGTTTVAPVSSGSETSPEEGASLEEGASFEEAMILGEDSPGVPVSPQGPVSFFVILRTIVVLLLAAAAIYGLVYFLKRIARPREPGDPNLRVLASAPLGQNRFIHAVTLGSRVWLVGSGEGGVTHIADVEEQEAIDALVLEESRRNAGMGQGRFPDFLAMLRRFSPSPKEAASPSSGKGFTGSPVADNIRKRQDRLKGL
jgi:flagellar protein FliO/FliZ